MKIHKWTLAGAVLMILLGIARGFGGISLLVQGDRTAPGIIADMRTARILASGLILVSMFLIVSAVGIIRRKRSFFHLGIAAALAFLIDGAVNGFFLYGGPRTEGMVMNTLTAAVIVTCLRIGRRSD
jgi:hypothetical protein